MGGHCVCLEEILYLSANLVVYCMEQEEITSDCTVMIMNLEEEKNEYSGEKRKNSIVT